MILGNACCTIYLKLAGGGYLRQYAEGVHWEDVRGVNFSRTGAKDADAVSVLIPFDTVSLPLDNGRERSGHYLLRGEVTGILEVGEVAVFLKSHDALTITSVACNNYGPRGLWHWEVNAK